MRLLVTGSLGLLGQALMRMLAEKTTGFDVLLSSRSFPAEGGHIPFPFQIMDVTDPIQTSWVVERFRPDAVIHTAAMTRVDPAEKDPEACWKINVTGTENLLKACARTGSHFIHLSTDFVFDGKAGPYRETEPVHPVNFYGKSKAASEELLFQSAVPWTILRTILVYGATDPMLVERSNFALWVKNSLEQSRPIRVASDQWRMPTLVQDLAWACLETARRRTLGIFHISGPEMVSVFEFAQRVAHFFKLPQGLMSPVDTAELGEPAPRPPKTGFILEKARRELGYAPHSLEQGLELLQKQIAAISPLEIHK